MASEEVPEVNIVGNTSDTEYDEDPVVDEEAADDEETAEGEEAAEGRIPKGSWQGSIITQADIDRLRRRRQIPEGVLTRVPPDGAL